MDKNFSFRFEGKIKLGANPDQVMDRLSTLFKVASKDWRPVFEGKMTFARTNIDSFTAKQYYDAFAQAGALGKISSNDLPPVANPSEESIPDVPIYEANDLEDRRAKLMLRIGATFLFIFLTMDDFLQKLRIEVNAWTFLIPSVFLAIGGYYYAKGKAQPPIIGALLGGSLLGLPLLLLLRDKRTKPQPRTNLQWLLLIVICATFLIFGAGKIGKQNSLNLVLADSNELRSALPDYPKGTLKSELEFNQLSQRLSNHLLKSLKILEENELRIGQARKLVSVLREDVSRFYMWCNYQKYLAIRKKKFVPKYLQFREIDRHKHGMVATLKTAYQKYRTPLEDSIELTHLAKFLFSIREAEIEINRTREHFPDTPLTNKFWRRPPEKIIDTVNSLGDGIIEIRLKRDLPRSHAGKTIILAFSAYPRSLPNYSPNSAQPQFTYKGERIGGTLEDRHVINAYSLIQLL